MILSTSGKFTHADNLPTTREADLSEAMSIFDVMYNCRAMRRLDTRDVPEELLIRLVDAANQAPSGANRQRARWIVVRDAAIKKQIADLNRRAVVAYLATQPSQPDSLPHHSGQKRKRMFDAVQWQMEHLHEVPTLIIACLEFDTKINQNTMVTDAGSIWPGIQNLLLSARALGLGATPTTLVTTDHKSLAKVLELPETMAAYCMIPVGYPTGKFGPVSRRPVKEIMRFDTWK